MKKFNSLALKHISLFNLITAFLILILFCLLFFVVKFPVEDLMKKSLADGTYRWLKYNIYRDNSFAKWFIFILGSIGVLGNFLLVLYLIIISIFNKRSIILLYILAILSIIYELPIFIGSIKIMFIPYLVLSLMLLILIIKVIIINKNYK